MKRGEKTRKFICTVIFAAMMMLIGLCVYWIIRGFPIYIGDIRFKNLKKPFFLLMGMGILYYFLHPEKNKLKQIFFEQIRPWLISWPGLVCLFATASMLFMWRQITEYLAVQINFIPFMYYPAMLQRFVESGMFNFTGQLHDFYHLNNILYFLAPLWKLLPDPLLLVVLHGPLLASAVFPIYGLSRHFLGKQSIFPWFIALIYLNYSYLENLQFINFGIEAFYPVALLSLLYFGVTKRIPVYFLGLFLTLLIKEDAFIYAGTAGLFFLFMPRTRILGLATGILSLSYEILLLKWFVPWTGSNIMQGNMNNFSAHGESVFEVISSSVLNPAVLMNILFGHPEKIETYLSVFGHLLFIPLFSPTALMIFPAVLPPFIHMLGCDQDFFQLHYHYAAPVIPFAFFALICGLATFLKIIQKVPTRYIAPVKCGVLILLLFLNVGKYRSAPISQENSTSIAWARDIPQNTNLVTHGHLLPYVGHRPFNYYFARPWTVKNTAVHREFMNADYYLFDYNINLYPWTREQVEDFQKQVAGRSEYRLLRTDGTRFIYERAKSAAEQQKHQS